MMGSFFKSLFGEVQSKTVHTKISSVVNERLKTNKASFISNDDVEKVLTAYSTLSNPDKLSFR